MRKKYYSNFLKHAFIPHEGNEYKPHFFREHFLLSMVTVTITLLIISFTSYTVLRTTTFGATVAVSVITDLTNTVRIHHGLLPLHEDVQLIKAASLKGNDMATRQYFSHFAPDGTTPWHWFSVAGYKFLYAGENLAINFHSSEDVEKAWMSSPKHRDNILNPKYEDIGIAIVKGTSENTPVLFIVQLFGKQDFTQIKKQDPGVTLYTKKASSIDTILFNASYYINYLYIGLVFVVMIALGLMIFIEIKKQHYKHVFYGVALILLILSCIFINAHLL
jgi:uncharacterized protein YkwD